MLRVYFASKLRHAEKWQTLCAGTSEYIAHARWLKHSRLGTPDTPEHAHDFWLQDEHDVRDADAVVVYAEQDDHLRGALVEAGIALACRIPVFVIGEHPDYGTWQYHPGVERVPDLEDLDQFLRRTKPRYAR
jgi:nucleoside 2-deoxyribosyltransferase